MQIKQRLVKLSRKLNNHKPHETIANNIQNMTTEEIQARIKELTCKALRMSAEEYDSLTESERQCLHFEMHTFLEYLKEGNSIDTALQKLKVIRPDYRKEIERYVAKLDE